MKKRARQPHYRTTPQTPMTVVSISMSEEYKRRLQLRAIVHDCTVSALVRNWLDADAKKAAGVKRG